MLYDVSYSRYWGIRGPNQKSKNKTKKRRIDLKEHHRQTDRHRDRQTESTVDNNDS